MKTFWMRNCRPCNGTIIHYSHSLSKIFARHASFLNKSQIFLFHDEVVADIHGARVTDMLLRHCKSVRPIVTPQREEAKTLEAYIASCHQVLNNATPGEAVVISLGGGATANAAGFVAATAFRGLPLILIPTTVLAQVDAAVDTKQGINTRYGKNTLGAIYAPHAVLIDPTFLHTLKRQDFFDGFSEIAKHALAQDSDLVDLLFEYDISRPYVNLDQLLLRTIELKLKTLEQDDPARTLALQYGHAIGHAIELASDYSVSHGHAIAIGMIASADIAVRVGAASQAFADLHRRLFHHLGISLQLPQRIDSEVLRASLRRDKYSSDRQPRMALLSKPGAMAPGPDDGGFIVDADRVVSTLEHLHQ